MLSARRARGTEIRSFFAVDIELRRFQKRWQRKVYAGPTSGRHAEHCENNTWLALLTNNSHTLYGTLARRVPGQQANLGGRSEWQLGLAGVFPSSDSVGAVSPRSTTDECESSAASAARFSELICALLLCFRFCLCSAQSSRSDLVPAWHFVVVTCEFENLCFFLRSVFHASEDEEPESSTALALLLGSAPLRQQLLL